MNLLQKITEAYFYLQKQTSKSFLKRIQIVVILNKKSLEKLQQETHIYKLEDVYYIDAPYRTPIIISESLPENIEIEVFTREDFERLEREKLENKISKMFNNFRY